MGRRECKCTLQINKIRPLAKLSPRFGRSNQALRVIIWIPKQSSRPQGSDAEIDTKTILDSLQMRQQPLKVFFILNNNLAPSIFVMNHFGVLLTQKLRILFIFVIPKKFKMVRLGRRAQAKINKKLCNSLNCSENIAVLGAKLVCRACVRRGNIYPGFNN